MTTQTRIECDHCGTDLTDQYPGEDYTRVTVERALRRFHRPSTTETDAAHLCASVVEPATEGSRSRFYRAQGSTIPMMLHAPRTPTAALGQGFAYLAREDFPERYETIASALERAWDDD